MRANISSVNSVELVAAINNLYVAMGSPLLPGWVATGGDPCGEAWQGVVCINTDIIRMYGNPYPENVHPLIFSKLGLLSALIWYVDYSVLNGANLGGGLGNNLGLFVSIKTM